MSFSTFGEIILRLVSTGQANRLRTTSLFAFDYAGSESNVTVSFACMGNKVQIFTRLPENSLGQAARQSHGGCHVPTENSIEGKNRIGTYLTKLVNSIRPSRGVYNQVDSTISTIKKHEFDWEHILKNQKWLHVSEIIPALSKQCTEECVLSVKSAQNSIKLIAND